MKHFFFSLALAFSLTIVSNQTAVAQTANTAVFAEFLGNGLTFSFNFDTRFSKNPDGFGGRVGIGYVSLDNAGIITVPVMANYLLGKNGKYFEIGAGATFISTDNDEYLEDSDVAGTLSFMYRRQPVDGGFMWRIGFAPIIAGGKFVPYYIGFGLGYAF